MRRGTLIAALILSFAACGTSGKGSETDLSAGQSARRTVVSSRKLTRETVKDMLNSIRAFHGPVADLPLVAPAGACLKEGFCRPDGSLTAEGTKYFARPLPETGGFGGYATAMTGGARFVPRVQVYRLVTEVTGIASSREEGEDVRQAQFNWVYDGMSETVLRYSGQKKAVNTGIAQFRLFDDGWRLDVHGNVPEMRLGEGSSKAFEWDDERVKAYEAANRAKRESEMSAKRPTMVLAKYEFPGTPAGYSLTISDNAFSVTLPDTSLTLSYGDCVRPRLEDRIAPNKDISVFCTWLEGSRSTQGNFYIVGTADKIDAAYRDFIAAYDAWRAKYPTYVTKR